MLAYGCGLRLSEVLALRVADIDSERQLLRVRQGKGAKDRLVPLSPTLLAQLRAYWRLYRPADWLFAGRSGAPLSTTSLQKAYTCAKQQAGVTKVGGIHALRHYSACRIMPSPGVKAGGALAWRKKLFGIIRGSSGRRAARRPGGSVPVGHRHWRSWQAPALSSACRREGRFASSPRIHAPAIRR